MDRTAVGKGERGRRGELRLEREAAVSKAGPRRETQRLWRGQR